MRQVFYCTLFSPPGPCSSTGMSQLLPAPPGWHIHRHCKVCRLSQNSLKSVEMGCYMMAPGQGRIRTSICSFVQGRTETLPNYVQRATVRNWFHKGLIGFCNPLVRLVFTAVDYAAELVSAREHHCRLHRWQQVNPEHLVDVNKLPVELLLATFICTKAGRMDSSISLKYNICSAEQVSKVVVGNTAKTELLFLAHKLRFSNYMVQEILL